MRPSTLLAALATTATGTTIDHYTSLFADPTSNLAQAGIDWARCLDSCTISDPAVCRRACQQHITPELEQRMKAGIEREVAQLKPGVRDPARRAECTFSCIMGHCYACDFEEMVEGASRVSAVDVVGDSKAPEVSTQEVGENADVEPVARGRGSGPKCDASACWVSCPFTFGIGCVICLALDIAGKLCPGH